MALTSHTFGVELEVITGMSRADVAYIVRQAGVECRDEGYSHVTRSNWKVVSDASVPGGCELVSPVLKGEEGFEQVRKVCKALEAAGVKVNKSCGFHVHIGVSGALNTPLGFRNIAKQWVKWEEHMDRIVAPSRRANANQYCRSNVERVKMDLYRNTASNPSMGDIFKAIDKCATVDSVIRLLNGQDYLSRYFKLNLTAMYRHGTVEIRMHQGTIDAEKAVQWVKVCLGIIDSANEYAARGTGIGGAEYATWKRFIAGVHDRSARKWIKARAEKFGTAPAEVA